ncbi:MAG: YlxR family protein [Clostridia bacterium]|nr:YlxR family protein [Clostridia bacterium]
MSESLRTCCVCRKKMPKKELIRIVKTSAGKIFVDKNGKADGRGTYICKCNECKNKLLKSKGLNRAFKCQVRDDIYAEIIKTD